MRTQTAVAAIAAGALAATLLAPLAPTPFSAPAAQAVTLPSGLQTGFQIDGNKTAGSPPSTFDWGNILSTPVPDGSFTFTPTGPYTTGSGASSAGVSQGAFYWDNGSLDASCAGAEEPTGQPGSQAPDTNPWVPGVAKPNDKANLCSGGYAVESVTTADGERHTILYAYWTRRTNNASMSSYDLFEGHDPGRCDDLLLEAVFPAGTTNFQTWTPAAGDNCANPLGAGTWTNAGRSIDFAFAMGTRTEGPTTGGQLGQTFAEYAIDLSAAGLFDDDTCSAFTVSQRFSRTGASPRRAPRAHAARPLTPVTGEGRARLAGPDSSVPSGRPGWGPERTESDVVSSHSSHLWPVRCRREGLRWCRGSSATWPARCDVTPGALPRTS